MLAVTGAKDRIERVADELGHAQWPSDATDIGPVAVSIVIGGLLGLPALTFGRLELGLSMFVGALLGGLVFGWLQSTRPRLGRVPEPALWLFDSIGLAGFLACVGINAGPDFVQGVSQSGIDLVLAAVVVTAVPQVVAIATGDTCSACIPVWCSGSCAGAGTSAPGLAAIQEVANSKVPALGLRRELRARERAARAVGLGPRAADRRGLRLALRRDVRGSPSPPRGTSRADRDAPRDAPSRRSRPWLSGRSSHLVVELLGVGAALVLIHVVIRQVSRGV